MTSDIKNYLQVPKRSESIITKFHNLLVIALVIIRRTHKVHRTDRGAESPTGPKLPYFTLGKILWKVLKILVQILVE